MFKLPDNRKVHVNPALAYVIGRYVGDGWKTGKKVELKSGIKEYMSYFLCSAKEEGRLSYKKITRGKYYFW